MGLDAAQGDGAFDSAWEALRRLIPTDLLEAKVEEALRALGRVNILVAGRTGVGKTTLVNAVFGARVGETGSGRPVTKSVTWYEPPGLPLRLCDSRGLELDAFRQTLAALEQEIRRCESSGRVEDRIHLAWLCILEPGGRVEEGELQLAALCERHGIPAIVVLTKALGDDEFAGQVARLLPGARAVIPVMAEPMRRRSGDVPAHGLHELVQATYAALPKAVERAFTAAQRIDIPRKRARGLQIAASAAAAAAAAALVPVPGAGTLGVAGINIGMVAGIAAALGVPITRNSALAFGASAAGGLAASAAGRVLLGEALKFIPGIGSVVGAGLEASAVAAATYGLGHGFTEFLLWFYDQNARMPDETELREGFKRFWSRLPQKTLPPPASRPGSA